MTLNDKNGRGLPVALAVVLLVGLALRVAYLVMNGGAPDFDSPVLDPQLNDYWARALVSADWTPPPHADDPQLRTTPYGRPPGYPWLLAAVYRISNGSYTAPRVVQLLAGLVNILLVFLLTRRLFNARAGVIAAFLLAVYWAAVYFEGELNSPVWEVMLALATVLLLLRWEEQRRWLPLGLAGVALGAGALLRPNVLLTGAFLSLWILYTGYKRYGASSKVFVRGGVFVAACVLTITPALVRNYIVSGEFVLISYYGGINAYIGNNAEADGVSPTVPDLYDISGMGRWNCFTYPRVVQGLGRQLEQPEFGYADASRYFYGRALAFWRESPLKGVALTLRKAWLFWGPHEISDSKVIYYERAFSPLLRWLPGFSMLLALALLGMVLLRFRPAQDSLPVSHNGVTLTLIYIGAYFLSILPFFIAGRYRFPVVPLLLPFAAYGLVQLAHHFQRREIKRLAAGAVGGVVLYLLVSLPVLSYTPKLSTWHCHRGIAHVAQERSDEAAVEFLKAIEANPKNDEALVQLGYLYARSGNNEKAFEYYRAAVDANPHNVYAQNNLGYEYFRRGQYEAAKEHCRQALNRQPEYTLAMNNLGNALLALGAFEQALEEFEQALRINPTDPHARYNMGNVYLKQEKYEAAALEYKQAFEQNPDNPDIANNLGYALMRLDKLEEALPWFEKALALNGEHSLARANLAILADKIKEAVKEP